MSNYIAFDLGGPLKQPRKVNDLLQLVSDGSKVLEIAERYDEQLLRTKTPEHEPGDIPVLMLIILLLLGGTKEADITRVASESTLTPGALALVTGLLTDGWRVFCITTEYEQYAIHITHKFGIYAHNVASTPIPLDSMHTLVTKQETAVFRQAIDSIVALSSSDVVQIKQTLDRFFSADLPTTVIGKQIRQIKPVRGRRKTDALKRFAEKYQEPLSKWVVVGDSIADADMLAQVDSQGGLAVAFNGGRHTLSSATLGLASTHISDLKDILQAWKKGGRKEAKRLVQEKEKRGGVGDRAHFHWLAERDRINGIDDVIALHARIGQVGVDSAGT
ncbi:MAG TPA: HAD hydrolase family protein [Dehalococcoidales bacterium]